MGINNLPSGGLGFRVSTGAGNLTNKLNVAVMHDGELKNLANNKSSILKVVKKYEGAIRVHKFDRLRQLAAYRQIKKLEGANLTYADKKDVKNLLKHFSGATEKVNIKKKISTINRAEDPNSLTKGGVLRLTSLNRDPENNRISTRSLDTNRYLDINKRNSRIKSRDLSIDSASNSATPITKTPPATESSLLQRSSSTTTVEDLSAYVGTDRVKRGEATRARLNYKHMSNLGTGEAAQKLQKDSFQKLNNLFTK